MIFGLTLERLLLERLTDLRVGRHEDAALRPIASVQERALGAGHLALRVQLRGPLAQVPDGATLVLGVPIGGALSQDAVEGEAVRDHRADSAMFWSPVTFIVARLLKHLWLST